MKKHYEQTLVQVYITSNPNNFGKIVRPYDFVQSTLRKVEFKGHRNSWFRSADENKQYNNQISNSWRGTMTK